jgi:hypothetical protein
MIKASVTVDSYRLYGLKEDEIEDYVRRELRSQMSNEIMKHVDVTSQHCRNTDSVTYTATLPISNTVTSGVIVGSSAGYNGTFTNNRISGIISKEPELRVMEFTKNGKVTRVELQYYDGDNWIKVPRHTFEE